MNDMRLASALLLVGLNASLCSAQSVKSVAPEIVQAFGNWDWPVYLGDQGRGQYSSLAQINATNVHRLEPAWEYHTGDATERSTMYSNPLIVDGVLYAVTPSLKAVALDAATGELRWSFDPSVHNNGTVIRQRNRGVTYWKGDADKQQLQRLYATAFFDKKELKEHLERIEEAARLKAA